jgi:polyferredoxin
MLALSLILSLLGFIALLVALYVGSAVWAWVCVGVAAVGVVLFFVDLVALTRR